MLELIILGFVFWIGYQTGSAVLSYRLRHIIYKEAKKLGITTPYQDHLLAEESPTVAHLIIEKANNILYLYDKDDNTFVCQGSTLEELATLAKKYKNIKYAAVMDDEHVYTFIDGKVEIKL